MQWMTDTVLYILIGLVFFMVAFIVAFMGRNAASKHEKNMGSESNEKTDKSVSIQNSSAKNDIKR